MKKALLVLTLLIFTAATASAVTITTGSKKGNYFKVGHKLSAALGSKNVVMNSKGSVENLDRLMDGTAQVGLVQMDTYAWYMQSHPEAANELEIMGELYKECAYLAVQCKGKVQNEDVLESISDIMLNYHSTLVGGK